MLYILSYIIQLKIVLLHSSNIFYEFFYHTKHLLYRFFTSKEWSQFFLSVHTLAVRFVNDSLTLCRQLFTNER